MQRDEHLWAIGMQFDQSVCNRQYLQCCDQQTMEQVVSINVDDCLSRLSQGTTGAQIDSSVTRLYEIELKWHIKVLQTFIRLLCSS